LVWIRPLSLSIAPLVVMLLSLVPAATIRPPSLLRLPLASVRLAPLSIRPWLLLSA
jgi:hypothetical protein